MPVIVPTAKKVEHYSTFLKIQSVPYVLGGEGGIRTLAGTHAPLTI